MARPEPTSVLTALGFAPAVDRTYRRLRTMSGRELSRVAAATVRTPEELLAEVEPLRARRASSGSRATGWSSSRPPRRSGSWSPPRPVHAERARHRLEGLTDAVGLLAGEDAPTAPAPSRTAIAAGRR